MALDPILQTLSFCRKAGKILYGFETVKNAVKANKILLLLTAADLSKKTVKEVAFLADKNNLPCLSLPFSMEQLGFALSRPTGVLGISEQGFANKIVTLCNEMEEN